MVQPNGRYSDYLRPLFNLFLILLERIHFLCYFTVATDIAPEALITLMTTTHAYLKFPFAVDVITSKSEPLLML